MATLFGQHLFLLFYVLLLHLQRNINIETVLLIYLIQLKEVMTLNLTTLENYLKKTSKKNTQDHQNNY